MSWVPAFGGMTRGEWCILIQTGQSWDKPEDGIRLDEPAGIADPYRTTFGTTLSVSNVNVSRLSGAAIR
jgi:hypothetical protein